MENFKYAVDSVRRDPVRRDPVQQMIESKIMKVNIGGWKAGIDGFTGAIYWERENYPVRLYASESLDDEGRFVFDITNEEGDYLRLREIGFTLDNVMKITPYLLMVKGWIDRIEKGEISL